MEKRPSFQFYPKDWLSDPNTCTMTAEEEGTYIRLLCYMWLSDDCTLPSDIEYLSKLTKGGSTTLQAIMHCFIFCGKKSERITHKRLQKEREKQDKWRQKSRLGGLRSGAARSQKKTKVDDGKNGNRRVVQFSSNQTRTKLNLSSSTSSSNKSSTKIKQSLGNVEINKMLKALKLKINITEFVDSSIERNLAKHCVNLMHKIGVKEFERRLDTLLLDDFHHKNMNKIKYVYNNIKGFIEPKISSNLQKI